MATTRRTSTTKAKPKPDPQTAISPAKTTWTPDERWDVLDRARQGDAAALVEFMVMLSVHPQAVRDLTTQILSPVHPLVSTHFVEVNQPAVRHLLLRRMDQMCDELAGPNPSPLESLLCERVAASWLALAVIEASEIHGMNGGPAPLPAQEHHDRMISRATKRYLEVCESLARVRRLLRPVMAQVNVAANGGQQLNIAGASLPDGVMLPEVAKEPHV